jgi:hypothetical protein
MATDAPPVAGSSQKRRAAPTPDSDEPKPKRQKKYTNPVDASISLAYAHLHTDDPSHQLYQLNADHIVRCCIDEAKLEEFVSESFSRLPHVDAKESSKVNMAKLNQVRERLATTLTKMFIRHLGEQMSPAVNIKQRKSSYEVEEVADDYSLTLRMTPCVKVDTDTEQEGGVATKRSARKERTVNRRSMIGELLAGELQQQGVSEPQDDAGGDVGDERGEGHIERTGDDDEGSCGDSGSGSESGSEGDED